ncbi:hypothetical protein M407DRAFT_245202 [Tulasnella calospora MUT 4182]|uniref:Uncharacterized protein n=1 Tax=Tulasnella calospora MUT 4182 TaxID=1051891 RepID=A0A0C3KLX5_9AGAM|nr:hypothetical protein M407DRAFT_245202 [Tulasnella calospora MUT 4182]
MSLAARRGMVRLVTDDAKSFVYHVRNSSGSFGTTSRFEHALLVEYDVGPPPHRIRVNNVENCQWLGVKWNSMVAIGQGATKPVGLVALDALDTFQSSDPSRRKWKGPHRSLVWSVASDGTLQMHWEDGATCVLSVIWRPSDHLITLVADPYAYLARYPQWKRARLVFEPFP